MSVNLTSPVIVTAVINALKADEGVSVLVGGRVFGAIPEDLPAGAYVVVTADRATVPQNAKQLVQGLVNIQSVAASESMMGLVLVAVQKAINGRVFDPVVTCVLHDTGPVKATPEGWYRRTDMFGAFHPQSVLEPEPAPAAQ